MIYNFNKHGVEYTFDSENNLDIPNTKIDLPGPQWKGSNWKFADYFASVERPFSFGHMLTEGVDMNWLIKNSHFNSQINIDLDPLRNAIDWDKIKID